MKHVNVDRPSVGDNQSEGQQPANKLEADMLEKIAQNEAAAKPFENLDIDDSTLAANVIDAMREIFDPEIPVNIYDLGLIYRIEIEKGHAEVDMTLTAPGCPVAQTFPGMVESSIKLIAGIKDAQVNLVWDPPWTQENLSEEARLQLGLI
ncbi:MAG: DUF59 domain-containing protein [Arenicellales bacterium]